MVHYDSDKSYEGMKWAYETLFPYVKKGGVFISDDINDNSAYIKSLTKKSFYNLIYQIIKLISRLSIKIIKSLLNLKEYK